jgi:hypothetical protein
MGEFIKSLSKRYREDDETVVEETVYEDIEKRRLIKIELFSWIINIEIYRRKDE